MSRLVAELSCASDDLKKFAKQHDFLAILQQALIFMADGFRMLLLRDAE